MLPLQPIAAALPTLAVATVYCFWHAYEAARSGKNAACVNASPRCSG